MRLLIDTQIFVWFVLDAKALRKDTRSLITDPANTVYLSHISLFEIAIKQKIGKLAVLDVSIPELMLLATGDRLSLLPIKAAHIAAYDSIPLIEGHRDPFDRLLLATAFSEGLQLVSADESFAQYAPLVSVIRA